MNFLDAVVVYVRNIHAPLIVYGDTSRGIKIPRLLQRWPHPLKHVLFCRYSADRKSYVQTIHHSPSFRHIRKDKFSIRGYIVTHRKSL